MNYVCFYQSWKVLGLKNTRVLFVAYVETRAERYLSFAGKTIENKQRRKRNHKARLTSQRLPLLTLLTALPGLSFPLSFPVLGNVVCYFRELSHTARIFTDKTFFFNWYNEFLRLFEWEPAMECQPYWFIYCLLVGWAWETSNILLLTNNEKKFVYVTECDHDSDPLLGSN